MTGRLRFLCRALLVTLAGGGCSGVSSSRPVSVPGSWADAPPAILKSTYTYKVVGEVELKADVYRTSNTAPRPVVVWLHGGTLLFGSRSWIRPEFLAFCRREEYVVVSLDYRLAPETKLPGIIRDIQDGVRWIREQGPQLFSADPSKIVVAGNSAGGYLAMMTGICVEPRPTALVSYWGYGEIDGDWLIHPHYHDGDLELLAKDDVYLPDGTLNRNAYYVYLRQHGLWTTEVSGFDPRTERDKLTPYCPVRNVTGDFPPTVMIHGTEDNDVPYESSVAMSNELTRHGVPHELISVPRAGHELNGGHDALVAQAHCRALDFIKAHLQ